MNMLINATPSQTMTSLEIAELTGKRHDNVKRTIEILSQETDKRPAVIQLPHSEEVKNHLGQSVTQYVFSGEQGKLDSITITAQLCPEFTAAIVKRWQELEAKQAPREPSKIELAQWVIEAETRLAQVTEQLAIAAPKAAAHDRIADAAGLFGVREAAKILGIKQNQLVSFLLDRKWAYRDERKTLQGYADKLNAGYIEHIFSPPVMTSEGEKVFNTMRLTAKGVSRIGEILAKGVAA